MKHTIAIIVLCAAIAQGASFPQDYQAALKLYDSSKYAEAKAAFDHLIELNPNPQAVDRCLVQAAYCETQLKANDKADALAAKIKEEHLRTLCRMNLLTMQSKYAEVVALVKDEDFSTWPDALIFDALMSRGNSLSRTREVAAAEKDFRAALGYTINDFKKATAHLRLGGLFKGQEALDCLEEVMKLKEPGPTMRYQAIAARARILVGEGKGALAIAEFDRLNDLTKQPHWTMVQMGRAATHESLGAPDKARACYESVVASSNPPADSLATAKAKLAAKP
jgi:tetratricopeptide (TPR) repeat protein